MAKESFRFIHASDFHLEKPLQDIFDLPDHLKKVLVEAPWKAAEAVFEHAVVENVDFVVLAGDVLHPLTSGAQGVAFLLDQFQTLRDVLVTPIFCDKNHSVNGIEARVKSEESGPIWSVLAPAVARTRCWKRIPRLDFTPNDLGMHGNAPKRTRINTSDDFGHFKS